MSDPVQAGHVLGKLLRYVGEDNALWCTNSIWYGSPQNQIEAFRAFQIGEDLQASYGYPELTDTIERKIPGLNAARVFGVDPEATRCAIDRSTLARTRRWLDGELGARRWTARRPFGPRTRRELAGPWRARGGRPD